MDELVNKINSIEDVYDDFVRGVINYAKRKPEHITTLNKFLDSNKDITTSDVVEFITMQPDFHNYSAIIEENAS